MAEEVRKLAEESAEAAGRVGGMIQQLQNDSSTAMETTDKTVESMNEAAQGVKKASSDLEETVKLAKLVDETIRDVAGQSEKQFASTDEMARALEELTRATLGSVELLNAIRAASGETASEAENISVMSQEMSDASDVMNNKLQFFQVC